MRRSGGTNVIGNSSGNSNFGRKPTSALSKIGKHVPPPISPILSLKSTTNTTNTKASNTRGTTESSKDQKKDDISDHSASSPLSVPPASNNCAWRIPKATENTPTIVQNITNVVQYPQRKVPALTPEPVKIPIIKEKEQERPKSFLERIEEFPDLKKLHKQKDQTLSEVELKEEAVRCEPQPQPPTTCIGRDFNFLEDDGWLDGDDIDYSQNLFQDDDHFIFPVDHSNRQERQNDNLKVSIVSASLSVCDVKAKTLLAERCHSSKKQDIWKRSDESVSVPKIKIKILKRPEYVTPSIETKSVEIFSKVNNSYDDANKTKDKIITKDVTKDVNRSKASISSISIKESILVKDKDTSIISQQPIIKEENNIKDFSSKDIVKDSTPKKMTIKKNNVKATNSKSTPNPPSPSDPVKPLVKKFSTGLKLKDRAPNSDPREESPSHEILTKKEEVIIAQTTKKEKVVYASASKSLQKVAVEY